MQSSSWKKAKESTNKFLIQGRVDVPNVTNLGRRIFLFRATTLSQNPLRGLSPKTAASIVFEAEGLQKVSSYQISGIPIYSMIDKNRILADM
ncbi:hypothetical protein CEXT_495521 [Caerostris extrusa]|uniref:Uncharacterized protein n=1 Tax=Caerostris extrusa TaxID=172846 RepID=A0AAV4Q2A9_CAEEX|nr:hypothetical protein CEXT_495521 [Caerostris extrusa]